MNRKFDRNERYRRIFTGLLFICSILIVYILFTQESRECHIMFIKNLTNISMKKIIGRPYLTYIISAVPNRINFTSRILNTKLPGFFNTSYKNCVSYNDSRMFKTAGIAAGSLMLTYIDLWREIGSKSDSEITDNEWIFIFEDDVDLVPLHILKSFYNKIYTQLNFSSTSYPIAGSIEKGLRLANKDGIIYLGTCGPTFVHKDPTDDTSEDDLIQIRRGTYYCTHAIAYTKWRARSIWEELATYRLIHNEAGADTIMRQWQKLSKTHPISIATSIEWPTHTGHFGFFYQARGIFNSIIQQAN